VRITGKREVASSRHGVGWGSSTCDGRDNTTRSEGRAPTASRACAWKEGPVNAFAANTTEDKVADLQSKLYQAAERSPTRRFHALYDKVYRADFLWRAWVNVAKNGGAPGVDGVSIAQIEEVGVEGVRAFLDDLAQELKDGTYRPLPVRRVTIPKANGGERHLGVPAIRDRVIQAAAKLVLEPVFEADFLDCSFGFRPGRSAHMALEVIREEVNRGRVWVVDADIASFLDCDSYCLLG
jgi:RNA-directed DNA polymerase